MARPLSFLFQSRPAQGAQAAEHIAAAFTGGTAPAAPAPDPTDTVRPFPTVHEPAPAIVHYAAVNVLPDAFGEGWVLLTTAYDEKFVPYITDLVNANPTPFNNAVKSMKDYDLELGSPVEKHLDYFVKYIQDRDLAQIGRKPGTGSAVGLFQAYDWTVSQIYRLMPHAKTPT